MSAHKSECPLEFIDCENRLFGCPVKVRRKDAEEHKNICNFTPCEAGVLGCSYAGAQALHEDHASKCCLALIKKYIDASVNARIVPNNEDCQVAYNNPIFLPSGRSRAPGSEHITLRREPIGNQRSGSRHPNTLLTLPGLTNRNNGNGDSENNEARGIVADHSFINVTFRQLDNLEHFATSLSDIISNTGNTSES
jgi:hypothetical protein